MNKVVDLAKVQIEKNAGVQELNNYINQAVAMNEELVALAIRNKVNGADAETVLDTFTDHLISNAFKNYSKEKLLEYVANGVLFEARSMLMDALVSNDEIKAAMELQEVVYRVGV
ncbi:hypothetical protein ABET51_06620 [Metabacillus fastidiosus]|uniref:hypothetical protein n=1 Tax=Metabacillus fastidiosus TaxID=1458 RepID=UPI003D27873F